MIQSMTGFGKVTAELPTKKVTIEIKALNSKQLDLSTRIPPIYKAKEMAIRSLLLQQLERGKVDFSIFIEDIHKSSSAQINQEMFLYYYQQILSLSTRLGVDAPRSWNELQGIFRLPDVISAEQTEADEQEWAVVEEAIRSAIAQLQEFRTQEGAMLYRLFQEKIRNITQLLAEIDPYEKERVEKIRARILDALAKLTGVDYDQNRLEQELIYYIEKLDINEEKNRLSNHLKYFLETLEAASGQGKKLGFIAQEMGREINTLGSKSNHAEMQKLVVRMKDELEQIKEQVLNVL
ncbi:YicC family protein [Parabacteroides sp. An277]|uniref:YicC/YloC family endoribonuclease n=1 Tax=Parabacteroides sp. An277 TaxID=1965619 RepID=UPI000B3AC922|nr:YicC/YloC family endoribonuclease [Parabacteroides sp. An277]OUO50173.1 YicC family protein [Parabacteroides sp. An277]